MAGKVATKPKRLWTVDHTHRNVTSVNITIPKNANWEQWVLLRTDAHHDNPKCDQKLEKKHLDQARERNAAIIDNGDLFCAMQGKWDKRSDKNALRPEHQTGTYLDALVDTAAEFYKPYADLFAVLGRGNHETAITKMHETDLTDRLADRLKVAGSGCIAGGYGGWVRFLFSMEGNQFRTSKTLYHYHGSGGGGPVTKGVIQTNRMVGVYPDADIIFTGHTHDEWIFPIQRARVSPQGKPYQDEQLHLRAPGYKNAWDDGYAGFEVERMHQPRPTGAMWLRFFIEGRDRKILMEATRAK